MNTDVSPAELKLINGTTTVTVRPRDANAADPIMCKSWDLGAPDIRRTTVNNAGSDGTTIGAGYLGSRTVTLELQILGGKSRDDGEIHDAYWYAEKLTAMAHPQATPTLAITRNGGTYAGRTFNMALAGQPYTMTMDRVAAAMLSLTMVFLAPTGTLEGPLYSVQSQPAGQSTDAWVFPEHLPDGFGHGPYLNPLMSITVGGSTPISPTIYITGPATNPRLESSDGDVFAFSGLTLAAGETVQIDMGAGTVLIGDAVTGLIAATDASRYQQVDFSVSTFWRWDPGVHTVRFLGNGQGGTTTIQWRERQLTI